jgi:fused signal recognition particle receptor
LAAFFNKLGSGLKKTREGVFGKINRLFSAKRKIDDDLLEELEEILIAGDVGVETSLYLLERISDRTRSEGYLDSSELENLIREEVSEFLIETANEVTEQKPHIILVVGVNGTGKTTSIAKLANHYQKQGKKVLLAAGDTFRAAAIEQLGIWGDRLGCDVIRHQSGSDPSAVVFDALSAAKARNVDYLIIDTAGRLHNKSNLMNELQKIFNVIGKQVADAPHEVILVVDASTGQNAVNQAREFRKTARVDSIFLTKLDGTAKGGVVLAINKELKIPVKYIGVGEQPDDFALFDAKLFVEGLFGKE